MDFLEIQRQLDDLMSNGVELSMPELARYQAISRYLKLHPGMRSKNTQSGGELSAFKGRGMEFDEARVYQAGDDIRNIDWRVTARTGTPHTKIFREERERPVFLFTDLSDTMKFGSVLLYKSIQASHLTALYGFSAIQRGDKLGAVVFNQSGETELKPKANRRGLFSVLDTLKQKHQEVQQTTRSASAMSLEALERLNKVAKPGSLIQLISDFYSFDEAHFKILGNLSRHCEIRANLIFDPLEWHLPKDTDANQLVVTDGKSRQTLDLTDSDQTNEFSQKAQERILHLKDKLMELKIDLRCISSGLPIEEQLSQSRFGLIAGVKI